MGIILVFPSKTFAVWGWCTAAALIVGLTAVANSQDSAPPNIVHIIVDDLGWNDVGFHESDIRTPVIDRLAAESVVLSRFYVTPICSPTRAGVLTGRYPFRFGIWGGVVSPTQRHGLPPSERTMAELLVKAGYQRRVMLGKWHLGLSSTKFHPLNHGFTEFYGHYNGAIDYFSRERFGELDWHRNYDSVHEDGYSTDLIGRAAAKFITGQDSDSPFYMVVAFNAPHSPIQAKQSDLKRYGFDSAGKRAPNTDRGIAKREKAPEYGERGKGNTVRQTFSAMVASMDENLGRVLKAIDEKGIRQNTIVLFHSDNGGVPKHGGNNHPLRGNKFTTWEGGVRVVSMIRWPDRLASGIQYDSPTAYIDVLPTLAAAAGVSLSREVDGINLLPYLEGKQSQPQRTLLLGEDTAIRGRWKLKGEEFFDLSIDPGESAPISNPPPSDAMFLRNELARFTKISGPPTVSTLPPPENWPPAEWKLPKELLTEASR